MGTAWIGLDIMDMDMAFGMGMDTKTMEGNISILGA